jgi:hypothetical protein
MVRRMEMLGGMPVRRIVATADVATGAADAQMHPRTSHLQALLATARARMHLLDGIEMRTFAGHLSLLIRARVSGYSTSSQSVFVLCRI